MYFGKRRTRRKSRRRAYAANPVNPRRRRRHVARSYSRRRHSYGHNPPGIRSIAGDLGWAAAGFMSTKVVGNMVTPMIAGVVGTNDIIRIGIKLGVAYVSAWSLSSFMGQRVFMPAMVGGSLEAIQDAIKTFIAPTFPMLAANYEPLQLYYEQPRNVPALRPRGRAMGLYDHMGDGLSPDHDAVV
jgi:hypothetical protein